ncbi:MAG: hypothetical protein AB7D07_12925, partial [Desulfovibrionaceae bacterium]
ASSSGLSERHGALDDGAFGGDALGGAALTGRPKMATCFVSEKIQIAYVCAIHCAPWIFSLPRISPFLNGLHPMRLLEHITLEMLASRQGVADKSLPSS